MRAVAAPILFVVFMALPLCAAPIAGSETAAFRAAVAAWLEDDEATALPALAALAGQGNRAAQVLVALIDKSPELQGPWLSARSREERMALMRAPGGISGTSWMRPAARAGEPLAALFVELWTAEARPELVLDFAAAGEPRAAREALVALVKRQHPRLGALAEQPGYPPELRALVWADWLARGGEAAARAEAAIAALDPGDPQRLILGHAVEPAALEAWLLDAPAARPLADLCRAACPEEPGACARAGFGALGSILALGVLGSPAEALIPTAVYAASRKSAAALMRRIQLTGNSRARAQMLAAAEATSSCFAARMAEEWRRF